MNEQTVLNAISNLRSKIEQLEEDRRLVQSEVTIKLIDWKIDFFSNQVEKLEQEMENEYEKLT